ncbi:MAG: hypothetical protein DRP58_02670 [Spirochaetes bacterium]|nr:MAG: hypothetical protein DRP58_02670 [Spirochaetota bacterium]
MKINKLILFSILIMYLPLFIYSQSNTVIDQLLADKEAKWGQTAYLVLTAAELLDENVEIEIALKTLVQQNWKINIDKQDNKISLREYSFLLMKAFNIKGGLMYGIFPGPRYAARELGYLGFLNNNKDPYRKISGEEVLRILGRVLEWKEINN